MSLVRLEWRRATTGTRGSTNVRFRSPTVADGACRDLVRAIMTKGRGDDADERRVCIKRFEHARARWFNRELAMLIRCQGHPHVLGVLGWYGTATHMHIVTPMHGQTLREAMLSLSVKVDPMHVLRDVTAGVRHLHSCDVLHRDIKPENVVIDTTNRRWVVIDMGLSRVRVKGRGCMTPNTCTLWYRAPELLVRSTHYSAAVDTWAVGCVFAEMLLEGRPLFGGRTDVDQLQLIFHRLGVPGKRWWNEHAKAWPFGSFESGTATKDPLGCPWEDIAVDKSYWDTLNRMLALQPRARALPL